MPATASPYTAKGWRDQQAARAIKCPVCAGDGVVEAMNCYPCPKCQPDAYKTWAAANGR